MRSGRVAQALKNPQEFMEQAAGSIQHAKRELMVEGIKYERIAGLDKGSEGYKRRCDILLIQAAVQFYMQNLKIDDEVNCPRLKEIIWSKRDGVNLELFAVKRQ